MWSALSAPLAVVEPQKFSRVAVVGDLHGDYKTLKGILEIVNLEVDLLVFLGDYADRGPDGVEVIRTVADLQQKHPTNVVALMGNHEDFTELGEPQFNPCTLIEEATAKTGSWGNYFTGELKPFIDTLHIAALIPNNALLVHGGISSRINGVSDLQAPSEELRLDLLWSDPLDGDGEDPNYARGAGVEFGADVSAAVCKALGVGRIIRSHQPQLAAAKPFKVHDNRVITVNATSVYGGNPFVYFVDPKSKSRDSYRNIR